MTGSQAPPPPGTIGALWQRAVAAAHAAPPFRIEEEGGGWRAVPWDEADTAVQELAHGLLALGIGRGDRVGIVCGTRLEWAVLDYALALAGATSVPVYPSSSPGEIAHVLRHAGVLAVVAETPQQLAAVEDVRPELPALRHVLPVAELAAVRTRGREAAASDPGAVDRAAAAVTPGDAYTIIYTSGTTGPAKGCVITHANYVAMTDMLDVLEEVFVPGDEVLLYLPLAHTFGRLMHLCGPRIGFTLALVTDPARLMDAVVAVRPTVLPSVPRLFEKVHAALTEKLATATGVEGRLLRWAVATGLAAGEHRLRGERPAAGLALRLAAADRLVLHKVRAHLGGRVRICLSGGAPLSREVATFLHAMGLTVLEGYGLTEATAACTANLPSAYRFGTVGKALPGVELRLDDDGELLARGATVFAGYLDDPESTAAVLAPGGWLRTGDVAAIDADGFVAITDRKKDIIVTASGKNIAPQNVENELKGQPGVSQALVVGDRRPYVVALITLDEAARAAAGMGANGGGGDPVTPAAWEVARTAVARVNAGLARHEQVKRFAVLPHDFTQEAGEVTPTLKLRRRLCEERYAAEIEAVYTGTAGAEAGGTSA